MHPAHETPDSDNGDAIADDDAPLFDRDAETRAGAEGTQSPDDVRIAQARPDTARGPEDDEDDHHA